MRGSLVVLASHFVARVSLLFAFLSLPFSVLQLSPLRTALFYGSNKRAWHGGVVSVGTCNVSVSRNGTDTVGQYGRSMHHASVGLAQARPNHLRSV